MAETGIASETSASAQGSGAQGNGTTPERILQMSWSYAPPIIMEAAVRTGIFDALDRGPRTADQVAEELRLPPRGVRMLTDALVGLQLATRQPNGTLALVPEAATFLVRGKPSFLGGSLEHTVAELIPNWLKLTEVVKTGRPATRVNSEDTGSDFFERFVETALLPMNMPAAQALARSLALGERRGEVRVLDLAAGSGVWSIALTQSGANVRATAVDFEQVLSSTRRTAERFGVADRFTFRAGDLSSADLGSGYAVAVLGHILHSEGEEKSRRLLRRIFNALDHGGTIAIAEFLVNAERTGPPLGVIFAVNMLVHTDEGTTYSFEELKAWLEEVGFAKVRELEAPGPSPLVLADKP